MAVNKKGGECDLTTPDLSVTKRSTLVYYTAIKQLAPCCKHHRLRLLFLCELRSSPFERIEVIPQPVESTHPHQKHTLEDNLPSESFVDSFENYHRATTSVLLVEVGKSRTPRPVRF